MLCLGIHTVDLQAGLRIHTVYLHAGRHHQWMHQGLCRHQKDATWGESSEYIPSQEL